MKPEWQVSITVEVGEGCVLLNSSLSFCVSLKILPSSPNRGLVEMQTLSWDEVGLPVVHPLSTETLTQSP